MIKRILLAIALLVVFASPLHAQLTTVTASSIKMAGVPVASGTVTFIPTNSAGQAIAITAGGTLYDAQGFTANITGGAIVGTFQVPNACTASPTVANTQMFYLVRVFNRITQQSFTLMRVDGVCGTTWPLDSYVPTQSAPITATGVMSGASVPARCVGASIFYTLTSPVNVYNCVSGAYVLQVQQVPTGASSGIQLTSGSMARFFDVSAKPMSQKVIAWVGDSTVQSENKLFTELTTYASSGGVLTGMTTTPLNINGGTGWVINAGNLWNLGVNGQTASGMVGAAWIQNTVCTYNPDLVILRGLGINDVRTGATTQNQLQGSLNTLVTQIQTYCPWTDVLWTTENSLLSTDPTSAGLVTATSTTETLVDGATSGVTAAGSHVVTLAAMPTSLFIGGTVVINSGLGDQETVTITALTNITFTASFAATHAQGFTVGATMPVAAQAYSNILLNSVGQLARAFPGVATFDLQSALYGTAAPPTSTYMKNQLHPSDAGATAEADLIGNVVMPALQYRPEPFNNGLYPTWGKNLLAYSSNFNNWTMSATTVSGNQLTATAANFVYQTVNVSPSTQYTFSFYGKLGTLSPANYAVYDQTNSSFIVASTPYQASLNANTWTRISGTFTTAANTAVVRVYLCGGAGAGTCFADHAMVNTGASALVWSPGTIQ